jgi:hypothetical protein
MEKYFVYSNKDYPWPGARERDGVSRHGVVVDQTIEFSATLETANAICAKLNERNDSLEPSEDSLHDPNNSLTPTGD